MTAPLARPAGAPELTGTGVAILLAYGAGLLPTTTPGVRCVIPGAPGVVQVQFIGYGQHLELPLKRARVTLEASGLVVDTTPKPHMLHPGFHVRRR